MTSEEIAREILLEWYNGKENESKWFIERHAYEFKSVCKAIERLMPTARDEDLKRAAREIENKDRLLSEANRRLAEQLATMPPRIIDRDGDAWLFDAGMYRETSESSNLQGIEEIMRRNGPISLPETVSTAHETPADVPENPPEVWDREGDRWVICKDNHYVCSQTVEHYVLQLGTYSFSDLEHDYGPLSLISPLVKANPEPPPPLPTAPDAMLGTVRNILKRCLINYTTDEKWDRADTAREAIGLLDALVKHQAVVEASIPF